MKPQTNPLIEESVKRFKEKFLNSDRFSSYRISPNYRNGKGEFWGDLEQFLISELEEMERRVKKEILKRAKEYTYPEDEIFVKKVKVLLEYMNFALSQSKNTK
jgi:hypothetical protein